MDWKFYTGVGTTIAFMVAVIIWLVWDQREEKKRDYP